MAAEEKSRGVLGKGWIEGWREVGGATKLMTAIGEGGMGGGEGEGTILAGYMAVHAIAKGNPLECKLA
jgi:hypothetical protein